MDVKSSHQSSSHLAVKMKSRKLNPMVRIIIATLCFKLILSPDQLFTDSNTL